MNPRRTLLCALALGPLAGVFPARAQDAARVRRLGMLLPSTRPSGTADPYTAASLIPAALGEAGFVEGRNLVVERRYAEARTERLPAIAREHVADGGLMSYGSSLRETSQRVASAVARIFRGAKPGEIPVEQPTTFRLVVNAGTARAIGIDLPKALLLRADEVIS